MLSTRRRPVAVGLETDYVIGRESGCFSLTLANAMQA